MALAWKIVYLTGIAWESWAVFSPPTYSSPTDRWSNSALPRSIFWELACENKASECSCKVEHRVFTWKLNKSIAAALMETSFQLCFGKTCISHVSFPWWVVPSRPLQVEVCLMHLCTPVPLAVRIPSQTCTCRLMCPHAGASSKGGSSAPLVGNRHLFEAV